MKTIKSPKKLYSYIYVPEGGLHFSKGRWHNVDGKPVPFYGIVPLYATKAEAMRQNKETVKRLGPKAKNYRLLTFEPYFVSGGTQ